MSRLASRAGLVCLVVVSMGCADTARTGGLQLGVDDALLRPPLRIGDDHPFEFPEAAWDEGVEGTTVLRLLISRTGTVDSAFVWESSGHSSLDSAALAQAVELQFEPASQGGEPVQVWGRLPVIFPRPSESQ